eukprot:TRINITY_DN7070_c3_g1_i1.p1 TRINITY_DN7070_c3_g1~~TRINITY_DN7070_c3_g1_i1.p1  ORF type:complete len:172 (+),score=60.43 TRINITY_DN7070_c3_g1_i1:67-582(+)
MEREVLLRTRLAAAEHAEDAFVDACDILVRLLGNIAQSPGEQKFRRIKTQNPTIQSKLLSVKGMRGVLEALGWEEEAGGEAYVLPDSAVSEVAAGKALVIERQLYVKDKDMREAQEERKRAWDARQAELRRVQAAVHDDQEARKGRPKAQASHATARSEGGYKKFEPARGG